MLINANIYHFYRDLLLKFGQFLDNICNNNFRKIELNIQTRTLLYKDFDSSLKLPALNLQCSGLQLRAEHNNPLIMTNQILQDDVKSTVLLLNESKQQYIITKNQYMQLNIDVIINASSQLEILELVQYINSLITPNLQFAWELTTFIPIPDFLFEGWDITTDDIYYLYEQKLTERAEDKIINRTVYYGLFQTPVIINANPANTYPVDYTNNQTANLSFVLNLFVPSVLYRNDIPQKVSRVIIHFGTTNEPISTLSYDLINDIEEKTDYKFYRGVIISKNNLEYDNDNDIYKLTIDNILETEPNNYLYLMYFPDNTYIFSLDNTLHLDSYNDDLIVYTIEGNRLSDTQKQILNHVLNDDFSLDTVYFTKITK